LSFKSSGMLYPVDWRSYQRFVYRGAFIFSQPVQEETVTEISKDCSSSIFRVSIPSRESTNVSKFLATLVRGGLNNNSSTRGLTTPVYICLTQYYEHWVLDKNTSRNFLTSRKTCLIQNIIQIIAELQDISLREQMTY